jgi:hypothetical protein
VAISLRRKSVPAIPLHRSMSMEEYFNLMDQGVAVIDPNKQYAATPNSTTSYVAKGGVKAPSASTSEFGSSRGGLIPDRVPLFTSRANAIRTYEYMANDDVAVDLSLRAAKMPILAADFYIQAADDTPISLLVQEFVEWNLFSGLQCSWLALLEDVLRFYEYGVSTFETVYENRVWAPKATGANSKQYTTLKDIAARPTATIGQFYYDDNGRLLSVDQTAIRGTGNADQVNLKIDDLLTFTFNRKAGNLEGKSILRTAYKHWFYKNQFYTIDGIQKERHGMGFPVLTLPPNFTDEDKKAALELVRNIRTNEEAGAVLPPGFTLEFVTISNQPVDVLKSVDHHNGMIMLNVMIAFILAGVSDIPSGRGTAASSQDVYTKSLRYVGNLICDVFNLWLIPQLVTYNFPVTTFPKLGVRNIGETKDMQQWASAIANLMNVDGITPDYETEQWIRKIADFPLKQGGVQTPIQSKAPSNAKGNENPGKAGNTPDGNNPPQTPGG